MWRGAEIVARVRHCAASFLLTENRADGHRPRVDTHPKDRRGSPLAGIVSSGLAGQTFGPALTATGPADPGAARCQTCAASPGDRGLAAVRRPSGDLAGSPQAAASRCTTSKPGASTMPAARSWGACIWPSCFRLSPPAARVVRAAFRQPARTCTGDHAFP